MSKPFESIEKQQLDRVIDCLQNKEKLAEKGENLPVSLRALGVCHTLMKYYSEKEMYDMLIGEITVFDPDIFKITTARGTEEELDLLRRIKILNKLSVQNEMMLFDFLMSFAVEFRRVAKVISAKKKEAEKVKS